MPGGTRPWCVSGTATGITWRAGVSSSLAPAPSARTPGIWPASWPSTSTTTCLTGSSRKVPAHDPVPRPQDVQSVRHGPTPGHVGADGGAEEAPGEVPVPEAGEEVMSDQRPGLDDLKVGDVVHIRTYSGYSPDYMARVVKINRVWIEMEHTASLRPLRFRKDTQRESDYTTADRFETEAQYAWSVREGAAFQFLREQGINIYPGPWVNRRLELANAVRALLGLDPL